MSSTLGRLQVECDTFEALRGGLAEQSGRYAVVHGRELLGTWPSYDQALAAGYERCGLEPFLVKLIAVAEPVHRFQRDPCPV